MAVTFRILPDRGLVYVRYADFAGLEESFRLFAAYTQHLIAGRGRSNWSICPQ